MLPCKIVISAVYSGFNTGMPLFLSYRHFYRHFTPHTVLLSQSGGRWLLVGVAPERMQLTAVQEVDNKGHNERQAKTKRERVCVCVTCVCTYVDYCFQWCHVEWSEG